MLEPERWVAPADSVEQEIARLRDSIDAVNVELLRLLERRGALALRIMHLKRRRGLAEHDRERESAMLAQLAQHSLDLYDRREIETMFRSIFEASRSLAARVFAGRGRGRAS
jgi:chorismate mutase